MVCMEAVTAFLEGPACWVIVYGILRQRSWRYVLQLTVSLGQLYGDVLYFATTFYEGKAVVQSPYHGLSAHKTILMCSPHRQRLQPARSPVLVGLLHHPEQCMGCDPSAMLLASSLIHQCSRAADFQAGSLVI